MKKNNSKTIRKMLSEYTYFLIGLTFCTLLAFWGFYIFSNYCYQKNTDHVLTLNSFYNDLDSYSQVLNQYIASGEEADYMRVQEVNEQLDENMEKLQKVKISKSFDRDMKDLAYQLEEYQKVLQLIHTHIQQGSNNLITSSVLESIERDAQKANRMYQLMTAQYKEIYLGLFDSMNEKQQQLNKGLTAICVCLFMFIFALMYWTVKRARMMTENIANPVQTLTVAAKEIRDGKLEAFREVDVKRDSYEEVKTLISVFNMMVVQLRQQIHVIQEKAETEAALHEKELENMRIVTLLKSSELKALQMQMNPHFLFNTLNMIARTIDLGDIEKTSILLQKTAKLLRYNLDYSGKMISLAKEIEMLGNYVYLQEQRFGCKIFFDFNLDERFHDILIPCFILQPLVENSIIHGIHNKIIQQDANDVYMPIQKRGMVIIQTLYDPIKRQGKISIIDNGVGMTENVRKEIWERLESDSDQREKIGLANVHMRLKMVFGDCYQLDIKSCEGQGTEVSIILQEV